MSLIRCSEVRISSRALATMGGAPGAPSPGGGTGAADAPEDEEALPFCCGCPPAPAPLPEEPALAGAAGPEETPPPGLAALAPAPAPGAPPVKAAADTVMVMPVVSSSEGAKEACPCATGRPDGGRPRRGSTWSWP